MKRLLEDVKAFHEACGVPVMTEPTIPEERRLRLRWALLVEEAEELGEGCQSQDMVKIADAIADMIYVLVGTALECGIPLDRVWNEVQRSNMAKVDAETGKVKFRADGKVLKPDGWMGPDIEGALRRLA